MAVTNLIMQSLGGGAFRLAWEGTVAGATFYIYRDGLLLGTTLGTEYFVRLLAGESPVFEVLDTAADPQRGYPGTVTLAWFATASTDRYLVQELVSAVWTTRRTVKDNGEGYFRWISRFLEDVTSHQFRVLPVGDNENNGTAAALTALMVRHPDAPDVSVSYSAGTGKITIAAA